MRSRSIVRADGSRSAAVIPFFKIAFEFALETCRFYLKKHYRVYSRLGCLFGCMHLSRTSTIGPFVSQPVATSSDVGGGPLLKPTPTPAMTSRGCYAWRVYCSRNHT